MESIIRIGHEDHINQLSWKNYFPDSWQDPEKRRILMFSGKPDRDVRPKARLRFRDKNKPVFESNWHENAFIQVYDPKSSIKEKYRKVLAKMADNKQVPEPNYPGLVGCFASLPIAKSATKAHRNELMGLPAEVMPDFDNLVKFYLDVLQNIVIPSDERASTGLIDKFMGEHPGVMFIYYPRVDNKAIMDLFKLRKLFKSYACPDLFTAVEGTGELFAES